MLHAWREFVTRHGGGHSTRNEGPAGAAGRAADDDAEAIRERQLKLQGAASKARGEK